MAGHYAPPALLLMGGGSQAAPPAPGPSMAGYPPWALLLMQGGIGGGIVIPDPDPSSPPTFAQAVRGCLAADGPIMAALAGGLWWREAPSRRPGAGWPFAVYSLINEKQTPATNHGDYWHTGLLRFAVSAKSQDVARRIVDRMVKVVARADLEFQAGWLMELRPENPTTTGRPGRAPGGAAMWTEVRASYYMFSSRVLYPGQVDDPD